MPLGLRDQFIPSVLYNNLLLVPPAATHTDPFQAIPIADVKSVYIFDNDQDLCFSFGSNTARDLDKFGCFEKNSNTLFVLDSNGSMGYVLNYTAKSIKNGFIKVTLIDKKDENIEFIHNLINENAINS